MRQIHFSPFPPHWTPQCLDLVAPKQFLRQLNSQLHSSLQVTVSRSCGSSYNRLCLRRLRPTAARTVAAARDWFRPLAAVDETLCLMSNFIHSYYYHPVFTV